MRYRSPYEVCICPEDVQPKALSDFLCSLATGSTENGFGAKDVNLNMCRQCESPCGFGKKALACEKEGIPIV